LPASDAEKTIKEFFDYAIQRRRDGVMDFAAIVDGFRKVLQSDEGKEGAFSKRALKINAGVPCRRSQVPEEALH